MKKVYWADEELSDMINKIVERIRKKGVMCGGFEHEGIYFYYKDMDYYRKNKKELEV